MRGFQAAGRRGARLTLAALLGGSMLIIGPVSAQNETSATTVNPSSPGAKGAKIYCYMRGEGNTHNVSWEAAYALIKRQSDSLFKTSPEHAAVMITEAVVDDPSAYPNCGKYLGDLYAK